MNAFLRLCVKALSAAAVLAAAAVAHAAMPTPGRILVSPDGGAISANVDGGGVSAALALPDGSVLISGGAFDGTDELLMLRPDGTPDAAFGVNGLAQLGGGERLDVTALLRQADGSLLVVAADYPDRHLVVQRLQPNGQLDRTYGSGGVVRTSIEQTCGCGTDAALTPSGELLLTGGLRIAGGLLVERLTSSGAPDAGFGNGGVVNLSATEGGGMTVASTADSGAAVLSLPHDSGAGPQLTRLDASGAADTPVAVEANWGQLLLRDDGSMLLLDQGGTTLTAYDADGSLDTGFGAGGTATVPSPPQLTQASPAMPQLIAGPDGDVLIGIWRQGLTGLDQEATFSRLTLEPVTAAGQLDTAFGTRSLDMPFGGGASRFLGGPVTPGPDPKLRQDSFSDTPLVRRDGSYVAVGAVGVAQPLGEGSGFLDRRRAGSACC
jgi:uncharacterized delta-60 repeat protein